MPDDVPFDITFHKSLEGDYINVLALTEAGKEAIDELCSDIDWEEMSAPEGVECLWYSQIEPREEKGNFSTEALDNFAARLLERDLAVGLSSQDAKYCTAYMLNDDGTASVLREH
jgi:hypothetical protein